MDVLGTIPAIPTPLTDALRIDHGALSQLLDRLIGAGVDGVVVAGTSGEGASLDSTRRDELVRATVERSRGRTVIVGCIGNSTATVLDAIETAAVGGADVALVPPPSYYPASDASLVAFYTSIAVASPIAIMLYHIPARTRNRLSIEAIQDLAALNGIIGIKDSDGQALFHLDLLELQKQGFSVFQGDATMAGWSYVHGAMGAITPVSALYPEPEIGARRAVESGDLAGVRAHSAEMARIARLLRFGGVPLVTNLKGIGEILGIMQRWTEPPMPAASDSHLAGLRQAMRATRTWASMGRGHVTTSRNVDG